MMATLITGDAMGSGVAVAALVILQLFTPRHTHPVEFKETGTAGCRDS